MGTFTLNLSFILYLCVYLPQIIHNRILENLKNLSLPMHLILYLGYVLDLLYGFSRNLQWQYKTVSIVCLGFMTLQSLQLAGYIAVSSKIKFYMIHTLLFAVLCAIAFIFITNHSTFSPTTTLYIGFISRACFLSYTLPQIIKNYWFKTANAISPGFLYLNLILASLDLISAWSFDWGWPNKLAPPFSMICILILLAQRKQFNAKYES